MNDIHFEIENLLFDVRVAAVLVKDGKILVQRDREGNEYALPGGHVKIGETTSDALIRELKEETGAEIRCLRLLWTEECFYEFNGKQAHNLSYYYLIDLCNSQDLPDTGSFLSHKDNESVVFGWLPVEDLKECIIYPSFLKWKIDNLNGPLEHFVLRY